MLFSVNLETLNIKIDEELHWMTVSSVVPLVVLPMSEML